MDSAERAARSSRAEGLVVGLAEQGVVAVATTFVDNAGIARVKAVPLSRLPAAGRLGRRVLAGLRLLPLRRLGRRPGVG